MRHLRRAVLSILPFILPACSTTTMREGLWELQYVDVKLRDKDKAEPDGRAFPLPRRLARVTIESSAEAGGETAEIRFVEEPAETAGEGEATAEAEKPASSNVEPLYADIRNKAEVNKPTIQIERTDKDWIWRMWGVVMSPEEIEGSYFSAIGRYKSHVGLEGRWRMRWLRED